MLPLNLYARVRFFAHLARETAGAASTRSSLLPLFKGDIEMQTSGEPRREIAGVYLSTSSRPSEARAQMCNCTSGDP